MSASAQATFHQDIAQQRIVIRSLPEFNLGTPTSKLHLVHVEWTSGAFDAYNYSLGHGFALYHVWTGWKEGMRHALRVRLIAHDLDVVLASAGTRTMSTILELRLSAEISAAPMTGERQRAAGAVYS
ncbi:hypothetical protein ANO11243_029200 [Dothideomycetidae sp. 11243]|nr:hypothetical protein ANO11243_029200 [fungal sp. No.11243]